MKENWIACVLFLMQCCLHLNVHVRHNNLEEKIDNYMMQLHKEQIISQENILNKLEHLEANFKTAVDVHLQELREEVEYNLEVLNVLNKKIEENFYESQ